MDITATSCQHTSSSVSQNIRKSEVEPSDIQQPQKRPHPTVPVIPEPVIITWPAPDFQYCDISMCSSGCLLHDTPKCMAFPVNRPISSLLPEVSMETDVHEVYNGGWQSTNVDLMLEPTPSPHQQKFEDTTKETHLMEPTVRSFAHIFEDKEEVPDDDKRTVSDSVISMLESFVDAEILSPTPKSPRRQETACVVSSCPEKLKSGLDSTVMDSPEELVTKSDVSWRTNTSEIFQNSLPREIVGNASVLPESVFQILELEYLLDPGNFVSIAAASTHESIFSRGLLSQKDDIGESISAEECLLSTGPSSQLPSISDKRTNMTQSPVYKNLSTEVECAHQCVDSRSSVLSSAAAEDFSKSPLPTQIPLVSSTCGLPRQKTLEDVSGSDSLISFVNELLPELTDIDLECTAVQGSSEVQPRDGTDCKLKPFPCDVCKKAFTRQTKLESHRRRRHYNQYQSAHCGGAKLTLTLVSKDSTTSL